MATRRLFLGLWMAGAVLLGNLLFAVQARAQPEDRSARIIEDTPSHRLLTPQINPLGLSKLLEELKRLQKAMDSPPADEDKPKPDRPVQRPDPLRRPESKPTPQPNPQAETPPRPPATPIPPPQKADPNQGPPSAAPAVPPIQRRGLGGEIQRLWEEAKAKSRQETRERRRLSPEQSSWLRRLVGKIEVSEKDVADMVDRLRNGKLAGFQPEWWTNAMTGTAQWLQPLGRQANWFIRQLESLPGKLRLRLPNTSGFTMPSVGGLAVSPVNILTILGVLAAILALAILIGRGRSGTADEEALSRLSLKPVRPDDIHSRKDLVRAVDTLALLRWGEPSRWWAHSRLADELAGLGRQTAGEAFALAELYERARYSPDESALTSEHLEQARAALQRLRIA